MNNLEIQFNKIVKDLIDDIYFRFYTFDSPIIESDLIDKDEEEWL